jgi:hypothetical protein
MIVPGGGISLDGKRWISCRPNYLLPVKVLSRLFRRLMLEMLLAAHDAGRLQVFGDHAHLAGKAAFKAYLAPLHRTKWFVFRKRPFAGSEHYGLLASGTKTETIERARQLIAAATPAQTAPTQPAPDNAAATDDSTNPCPCCGGRMITIETFKRGSTPQHRPTGPIIAVRIDTS